MALIKFKFIYSLFNQREKLLFVSIKIKNKIYHENFMFYE